jgi:hypothetical protein
MLSFQDGVDERQKALQSLLAEVMAWDGTDRYTPLLRAALAFQRASRGKELPAVDAVL